MKTQDFTSYWY